MEQKNLKLVTKGTLESLFAYKLCHWLKELLEKRTNTYKARVETALTKNLSDTYFYCCTFELYEKTIGVRFENLINNNSDYNYSINSHKLNFIVCRLSNVSQKYAEILFDMKPIIVDFGFNIESGEISIADYCESEVLDFIDDLEIYYLGLSLKTSNQGNENDK